MSSLPDFSIQEVLSDRELFNKTVYTLPLDALQELKERWKDTELEKKVLDYMKDGVPEVFQSGFKAVLFRQVATPNYEFRRFMCVPDALELDPIFLEIHNDKFTLNNPMKYQLARLGIHMGLGKKGGGKIIYKRILDFNESHRKTIKEVRTLWGQSLIDFHHELFLEAFPKYATKLLDISSWLHNGGRTAFEYYREVVGLFVRNGILFENFVLEGDELEFTRDVFLPAFFEVWKTTGYKPLIVALEATKEEGSEFWSCYPPDTLGRIEEKERLISTDALVH